MCSPFTEHIPFYQEPILFVHRTDTDFTGALFLATDEQIANFQEHLLATEQITIVSRKPFSNIINEQIGDFQEGTSLRVSSLRAFC